MKEYQDPRSIIDTLANFAAQDMEKSMPSGLKPLGQIGKSKKGPEAPFMTALQDPMQVMGETSITKRKTTAYDVLRSVAAKVGIVSAIINTRIAQVSLFAESSQDTNDIGFKIVKRGSDKKMTSSEQKEADRISDQIIWCGEKPNKHYNFTRFLKEYVRDSLRFDQACFEMIPSNRNIPLAWKCVDSSTIRLAKDFELVEQKYHQLMHGQIYASYTDDEMAFGIRNPQTDLIYGGYGLSELEQVITHISGILWSETYNRNYFSQGYSKGVLVVEGAKREQLNEFKREWNALLSGQQWRIPVISGKAPQWLSLDRNSRDMEYQNWMEYLIKICSGVYQIDPAEINFPISSGAQVNFEGKQEQKIRASKDKGLLPLLRFIAGEINTNLVERINPDFKFGFFGLQDIDVEIERAIKLVTNLRTINDVRQNVFGLEPLGPEGDIILNAFYMQAMQSQQGPESQTESGSGDPQFEEFMKALSDHGDPEDLKENKKDIEELKKSVSAISDRVDSHYREVRYETLQKSEQPQVIHTGISMEEVKDFVSSILKVRETSEPVYANPPSGNVESSAEVVTAISKLVQDSSSSRSEEIQLLLQRTSQSEQESRAFLASLLTSMKDMQESYKSAITSVVTAIPKEITVITPPVEVNIPARESRNVEVVKDVDGRIVGLKEI